MGLMHMQRTQPEQLGVFVYIQVHFDLSGLISKASALLNHMKIVDPPPSGIEPRESVFL